MILSTFLIVFICAVPASETGVEYIPSDSRLYEDIDLLKTSGLISTLPSTSRPWPRKELFRLFLEADSNSKSQHLNLAQRAALNRLSWEFGEELQLVKRRKPVFSFNVDDGVVRADFFSRAHLTKEKQRVGIGTVFNNRPDNRFFFSERIEMSFLNPREPRVFDSSGCHNPNSRVISWRDRVLFEMERAYFGFKLPWVRMEIGRDELFWGPGYLSSVMLSDNAPALDQIQFSLTGPNLKFISFTAMLSRWNERHPFLSAQRLEVSLCQRLTIGGAMFNVYTYESAQDFSGMLNPLLPLYFSVANSGHGDNLLVGGDAVLYLPRTKIYGQLLIDNFEFNTRKDAPNCVGLQTGIFFTPQIPIDIRLEYALVTAFTYYHRLRDIIFANYSVPLGHEIGPDADQLWGRVRFTIFDWLQTSLSADYTRRGFYNRGDLDRLCFDLSTDTVFLRRYYEFPARGWDSAGTVVEEVERTLRIGPEVEFSPLPELYLLTKAALSYCQHPEGAPNRKRVQPEFFIKVEYRYR